MLTWSEYEDVEFGKIIELLDSLQMAYIRRMATCGTTIIGNTPMLKLKNVVAGTKANIGEHDFLTKKQTIRFFTISCFFANI